MPSDPRSLSWPDQVIIGRIDPADDHVDRTARPMLDSKRPNRRHFTDAARAAAKEARRRKKEMQSDPNRPEIFVARAGPESRCFVWEIRRFGGVLLDRGTAPYDDAAEARSAGKRALNAFMVSH